MFQLKTKKNDEMLLKEEKMICGQKQNKSKNVA